jgi:hypothetical protein
MRNSAPVAAVNARGISISVSAPNGSTAAATTPLAMSLLFACRFGTKGRPPQFKIFDKPLALLLDLEAQCLCGLYTVNLAGKKCTA